MQSHSEVKKPDFAFPQTVVNDANAELSKAIADNNAPMAINSLLRLWKAERMIDRTSAPAVIAKAQEAATKLSDSELAGIFDVLLANFYYDYYSEDRWKFNRRQTPLLPYPADLSEWSGEQFKAKIRELGNAAMAHSDALKRLKVRDYTDIITADNLTALYYPTLLDFTYQSILDLYASAGLKTDSIEAAALEQATTDASRILWLSKERDANKLKEAYLANCSNEYAGLLLDMYITQCNFSSGIDFKKWTVEQVDYFNSKFPANPFKSNLEYQKMSALRPYVDAVFRSITGEGTALKVKATITNANKTVFNVYKIGEATKEITGSTLNRLTPAQSIELNYADALPFTVDTTLSVILTEPGRYVIAPKIDGKAYDKNVYYATTRCVNAFPFVASTNYDTYAFVADPANGAPIKGAKVTATNGKSSKSGVTDEIGSARMPNKEGYWKLSVTHNGVTTKFEDVGFSVGEKDDEDDNEKEIYILTDRSIYHPGEKMHGLCVCREVYVSNNSPIKLHTLEGERITVLLFDANNQKIDTIKGRTDSFGRFEFEFTLPATGLTGNFSAHATLDNDYYNYNGTAYFKVSDYRMPDFELVDINVARDIPAKGGATIEGRAVSYSGMPLANVAVTARISIASWWRWFSPSHPFYSADAKTDADGRFKIELAPNAFDGRGTDNFFMAQLSAASLSGTTAEESVTFSLGKPYIISFSSPANVDGEKPLIPMAKAIGPDGKEAGIRLVWSLIDNDNKAVASGQVGLDTDISGVKPASYTLSVAPADTALADAATQSITVYNRSTDIVPNEERLWVLTSNLTYGSDRKVAVEYGTALDKAYIYYTVTADDDKIGDKGLVEAKKGYGTLDVNVPKGVDRAMIMLVVVHNCRIFTKSISIDPEPKKKLQIVCETFRDNLVPNAVETWKFSLRMPDGSPAKAALALDMYNRALDALSPHNFSIIGQPYYKYPNIFTDYPSNYTIEARSLANLSEPKGLAYLVLPRFLYISGEIIGSGAMHDYSYMGKKYKSQPTRANARMICSEDFSEDAEMEPEMELCEVVTGEGAPALDESEDIDMRDAEVPLAVWEPMLSTDAEGNVCYSFTVPNANAAWKLYALAWTKDFTLGSLSRDFVASKPIMVMPNAPRFLRQGDVASLQALVANKTEAAVLADIAIEFFNPVDGSVISRSEHTCIIEAMSTASVDASVEAGPEMQAVGYRVTARANGSSDGEQGAMPVLPSMASLVETEPFYLNPGQTEFSAMLPSDPGARISLTFSENPVWSVVSALPGLREETGSANSAAAAIFSAALARGIVKDNPEVGRAIEAWLACPQDSALVSMLEKNADLKAAVLSSTPWVQAAQSESERMASLALIFSRKETDAAISAGIATLAKLQMPDGGWAWGAWASESSVWVTENVLELMSELKSRGWMPADKKLGEMVAKAVKFLDAKLDPKSPDILYAILRPSFPEVPMSANGKRVAASTISHILKSWKGYTSPAYKAVAAMALHLNGYPAKARELMKSVSEFGVMTPSQGLRFPSVDGLAAYGVILEAYALIDPGCKEIDGLRQQLIVRKQGAAWGSAVVTSEVVSAIVSSGTRWTAEAAGAAVTAGGAEIKPAGDIEKFSGSMRADLTPYAGKELVVRTSGAGPAYGAVFSQFSRAMADVEASGCDDLTIEKAMLVRRGTGWEAAPAELKVGDKVKVQLTIHCKRNLSYVAIIDERPAAFEPADQLPGWIWSEGARFYRENRDSATNLYVSYLSPGTYLLTYEMNVSNAGQYSSGVASIQSQQAPEISAHSSGSTITVTR